LYILALLIFSPCVNPQQVELPFENIPVEEGIPTNVQHVLQDRTGYLWFATWSGLYKYDGYNFTAYRHDADDTASIRNNTLSVVYEDKSGIIWIGSRFGLERFDPKLDTFLHFTPNPNDT
jgi:two-component system, sensor histidine kinase ChiS